MQQSNLNQQNLNPTRSFTTIYNQINQKLDEGRQGELIDFMKAGGADSALSKLSKALTYYQVPKAGQDNTASKLNSVKWAESTPLTQPQKDELIIPLSRILNLDEMMTFKLVDVYFSFQINQQDFVFLQSIEMEMNGIASRLNQISLSFQNNLAGTDILRKQLERKFVELKNELLSVVTKVINGALKFYFQERKSLLESLLLISNMASKFEELKKCLHSLVGQDLVVNLITSLKQSSTFMPHDIQINEQFKDSVISLQNEEISIHNIMFAMTKNEYYPSKDNLVQFFTLQNESDFKGVLHAKIQQFYTLSHDPTVLLNQAMLQDLIILSSLNLLSLGVVQGPDNQTKRTLKQTLADPGLNTQISKFSLNARNALVYIAFYEAQKLLNQVQKDLKDVYQRSFFMEYLKELVGGMIFTQEVVVDQKTEYQLIVKNFLTLIHPNLIKTGMADAIVFSKTLLLQIFKSPSSLAELWKQNELKVSMFEKELNDPVQNKIVFIQLILTVCGNNKYKYGLQVYSYLDNKEAREDDSILVVLLQDLILGLEKLEQTQLSSDEFMPFISNITLFSTLIKQYPFLYEELNKKLVQVLNVNGSEAEHMRGFLDYHQIQLFEPMLAILMRSLHALIQSNYDMSIVPGGKILNALAALYTSVDLQKEIILCFKMYTSNTTGNFMITDVVAFLALKVELKQMRYKFTKAYLKLLYRIFQSSYPQQCLDIAERIHMDRSFLKEGLINVYKQIMENYFSFGFKDTGEFADFSKRLFKLTYALLSKFNDIPNQYKSQICQPYPKLNFFYGLVTNVLNSIDVESILMSTLDLAEKGQSPDSVQHDYKHISNRFWLLILEKGVNISKFRFKLNQMIASSLKCMNVLAGLVQLNIHIINTPYSDIASTLLFKTNYIQHLNSVQKLTQVMVDPSNSPILTMRREQSLNDLQFSLFNYIAYYVHPDQEMQAKPSQVQIEAIKFFSQASQIWEMQDQRSRPEIEVYFQNSLYLSASHSLKSFIKTFLTSLNQLDEIKPLQFVQAFFDLLITSCSSQKQFAEHVFKDTSFQTRFKEFFHQLRPKDLERSYLDTQNISNVKDLACKMIILLTQMSVNSICPDLLANMIHDNLCMNLQSHILDTYIFQEFKNPLSIDLSPEYQAGEGNGLDMIAIQSRINENNAVFRKHFQICQAYTVASYYMKFLSNEYYNHPTSKELKAAISSLFQFREIFEKKQGIDSDKTLVELWQYNEAYKNDLAKRNQDLQSTAYSYMNTMGYFEDQSERERKNNRYISASGQVYIYSLEGFDEFKYLSSSSNVKPYSLIMADSIRERPQGKLGPNFIIPADELEYLLKDQFYEDSDLIASFKCFAQLQNLALSYQFVNYNLTQAKIDFLLTVGKVKMRENVKADIEHPLIVSTSLYTIVGQIEEEMEPGNVKLFQNKLVELMIQIGQAQYKQVLSLKEEAKGDRARENIPISHFKVKQAEVDLELLSLVLGAINSQTEIGELKQAQLVQLENFMVRDVIVNLSEILEQQLSSVGVQSRLNLKQFRLESEQLTADLFTQLVQQCFALCSRLKLAKLPQQVNPGSVESRLSKEQMVYQMEIQYLKILSKICALMESGYCFQQCLSILSQALTLLSPDNIRQFMEIGQTQPLRTIIQRFINPNAGEDESISICKFFISYARIYKGALHLFQENILHNISINTSILKVNSKDLYLQSLETGESIRAPVHILWCLAVILIRTLNDQLIDQANYFKAIIKTMKLFEKRLFAVLGVGQTYQTSSNGQSNAKGTAHLSLALFEEIELLTGALVQIFNHADTWAALNFTQYSQVKDLYIYSVSHLFSRKNPTCSFGINPNSNSELVFNTVLLDQEQVSTAGQRAVSSLKRWAEEGMRDDQFNMTGLEFKLEICKLKIFTNIQASLLAVCLLNKDKAKENELMNTFAGKAPRYGSPLRDASQSSIAFTQGLVSASDFQSDVMMKIAYDNNFFSLEVIILLFKALHLKSGKFRSFIQHLANLDDWLTEEYYGLNAFLSCFKIREVLSLFDLAIQMGKFDHLVNDTWIGTQVECLLLENFVQVYENVFIEGQQRVHESTIIAMCDSLIKATVGMDVDMERSRERDTMQRKVIGFAKAIKNRRQGE